MLSMPPELVNMFRKMYKPGNDTKHLSPKSDVSLSEGATPTALGSWIAESANFVAERPKRPHLWQSCSRFCVKPCAQFKFSSYGGQVMF